MSVTVRLLLFLEPGEQRKIISVWNLVQLKCAKHSSEQILIAVKLVVKLTGIQLEKHSSQSVGDISHLPSSPLVLLNGKTGKLELRLQSWRCFPGRPAPAREQNGLQSSGVRRGRRGEMWPSLIKRRRQSWTKKSHLLTMRSNDMEIILVVPSCSLDFNYQEVRQSSPVWGEQL